MMPVKYWNILIMILCQIYLCEVSIPVGASEVFDDDYEVSH